MTREVCREMARRGWPVVLRETGTSGEIVYPYIREIKVIYATPDELANGYPAERMAVLLADRCGHSFTECLARQLRLPTDDEARLGGVSTLRPEVTDAMIRRIGELREMDGEGGKTQ